MNSNLVFLKKKYSSFCGVLLTTLMATDFTVSEGALRLRAIIAMRILSLFRGIGLARTTGDIQRGTVYFANARRKGKLVHQHYPFSQAPAGGGMPAD